MSTNPQIVFGQPSFAPVVQAEYSKVFEVLPRVSAALNDLTGRGYGSVDTLQHVILNLGLLAGVAAVELITLVGNGLGYGAMKITRTLLETAINAEYLRTNPTELDAYLGWTWVEKRKDLNYVRAHRKDLLSELTTENIATIEREYAAVKHLFEKPNKKLRGSWCEHNLEHRARVVGLVDQYRMVNPLSSAFIHGTVGGLSRHFNKELDEDRIEAPPSMRYCGHALVAGHTLLLFMIGCLSDTFAGEPVHSLASLKDDFAYAWPIPKEEPEANKR